MHSVEIKSGLSQADAIAAVEAAIGKSGRVVLSTRKDPATGDAILFFGRVVDQLLRDRTKYALTGFVRDAFTYLEKANGHHYKTFFRQRPAGSQWGVIPPSPNAWAHLDWVEVPASELPAGTTLPGCRYLRSTLPLLIRDAVEQIGLSTEIPHDKIFLVKGGSHGPYLATLEELPKKPATEAWLVLGPAGKEDSTLVPWTAFPGRMAATIPPTTESIEQVDLNLPYAVKHVSKETAELCA